MTNFDEVKQIFIDNLPNADLETIHVISQDYKARIAELQRHLKEAQELYDLAECERQKRLNKLN